MAVVLGALASYVTNMLAQMASEDIAMMIGVSSEIKELGVKLGDLKNVLADADRRTITDKSVRGWVEELKRAMYQATDIIDLCQLKIMEQGPSTDMGCLHALLFCIRNPLHVHDIGTRIKNLNQKLDDICKWGGSFNFIKLEAYQDRKATRSLATDRKTDSLMERSGAVGEKIEEDTRALVEVLTREVAGDKVDHLMVVAIVGVGGIGKTTLCKKVFNDEAIEGKFAKKIWLSITRDFNDVELLSTAITAAGGDLPRVGGARDKALLVVALMNAIKDKKIFLVLDDMWGVSEWDKLLMTPFSYGGPGSRVLITTRHDTVARSMKVVYCHHVDKLGPIDAWSLLKKQVLTSGKDEPELDMLKDIGLQIIAKCDGLPLAIKVMGGLLCKKEKTRRDWEDILNDDIWSVSRIPEELNYAIHLSYDDLSPCLQECFLHFSLKPKKTILSVNEVVSMWIGEGLVNGGSGILELEGKRYYNELILRNLIEPDTNYPGQLIGNMHDVIRSFAQFVARDESLVAHSGATAKNKLRSHSFLRLSIETKGAESDEFEWRDLTGHKLLRLLMLSGNFKMQPGDSLVTFSSLRTLFIESANFAALLESVCQLKHLRYLSLRSCTDISRLPENIHELKFLQHINLEGCGGIVKLPDSIVKLRGLRYLSTNDTHVNSIPRGFRALTNLWVLFGFPTYMDGDWCSLEELGPLSQLKELGLKSLENVLEASSIAKARVGAKQYLTALTLECSSRLGDDGLLKARVSNEEQQKIEVVFDVICPLPCLEYLDIKGYFGRQLPRWMMWTTKVPLENLRTLWMTDLSCCTQLPDGLCRLPCLEFLQVNRAPTIKSVGDEFLQPRSQRHHHSSQTMVGFPKLHTLILSGMLEWEEWGWQEKVQAMPALEEFFLKNCKLGYIPPGLSTHARVMKKLTIGGVQCLQSLKNFTSVVHLILYDLPDLTSMSNFPKLQKLWINHCPKLELLHKMNSLRRFALIVNYNKKQLPMCLRTIQPSHLLLDCSPEVLASMALGKCGPEWDKFRHIQHVEAYADDEGIEKRWHLFYSSKPYSMETNIDMQEWSPGVAAIQAKAEATEKERVMATARADAKAVEEARVVATARAEAIALAKARTTKKGHDAAAARAEAKAVEEARVVAAARAEAIAVAKARTGEKKHDVAADRTEAKAVEEARDTLPRQSQSGGGRTGHGRRQCRSQSSGGGAQRVFHRRRSGADTFKDHAAAPPTDV
ncbi:putative disease resistance protein RGA3 [Triticum urartu]|nr:putative disease resistance protein RGA3 [Triticum urartu]